MKKTKKTKKISNIEKAKFVVKKINNNLIDASFEIIENSVKAGEKWQKLTTKLIKKSEPLTKKQISMFVETAENLKQQADFGLTRLKKLVGYNEKVLDKAKKIVTENPLIKKAEKMVTKLKKEVSESPLVQKSEKITAKIKKEVVETFEELKEKAEDIVDDVKEKIENYTEVEKPEKTKTKKKENEIKKPTIITSKVKNDLKIIKGIGPKMESILNENGITSLEQLAKITTKNFNKVLLNAGVNTKIYNTSDWKIQAKEIIK
ncbi:MAG: hypothetical protein L3J23_00965 [Flavobacteriaceae bacterium]|nr:hypothetical protein [Flavobacteriaceae bacterium]